LWSADRSVAVPCYTCQYTDNSAFLGYECVSSPADYTQGPTTVDCGDVGCQTEIHSISTHAILFVTMTDNKTNKKHTKDKLSAHITYRLIFDLHTALPIELFDFVYHSKMNLCYLLVNHSKRTRGGC